MNRDAHFYTNRKGQPCMRLEILPSDTHDGVKGLLYAYGQDAVTTLCGVLSNHSTFLLAILVDTTRDAQAGYHIGVSELRWVQTR